MTKHGRISPAGNSTFAIGGVSCSADSFVVAESFVLRINFGGKNPAHRKSAKRCGKIRSAPLATPNRGFCHIGSADYIRRCCSSLRELRTSVNLQNPKNGSKLPSRDFANPPNR